MAKAKYTKGVTTVGEASFAHTIKTEEYNGKDTNKFSVNLHLGDKDTKKLKAKIADEWKKFTESEEGKKNKYKYDPELGCKEYKDKEYFKFKMTHIIETKKGDWERHVPIFDASGADISGKIGEIGNGEHMLAQLGKAGAKRWRGVRPTVRGMSMNPIDHPHGGGEGRNKGIQPRSPWGTPCKGYKTRKNKRTDKYIVHHR